MTEIKIILGATVYHKTTDFAFVVAHAGGELGSLFLQFFDCEAPKATTFGGVTTIGAAIHRIGNTILSAAAIASIIGGVDGKEIDLGGMTELQKQIKEKLGETEDETNDQEG